MFKKYKDLEAYPDVLSLIRIGKLYKTTKENLVNSLENNQ